MLPPALKLTAVTTTVRDRSEKPAIFFKNHQFNSILGYVKDLTSKSKI